MSDLLTRYEDVRQRISTAVNQNCDLKPPKLLAVSKKHAVDKIKQLAEAGQRDFGESYAQEAVEKIIQLQDWSLIWHFIGPIQSNKTKLIAENFQWVHSVDRLKVLKLLNKHRPGNQGAINVLLQLKVGNETSKSGASYEDIISLAHSAEQFDNICFRGLMCIPPPSEDFHTQCAYFQSAKTVFDELVKRFSSVDTLSMGMSNDLEAAIAQGTNLVRIGTDIFGRRDH